MKISNLKLITVEGEVIIEEWAELLFVERETIQIILDDYEAQVELSITKEYCSEDIHSIEYMVVN